MATETNPKDVVKRSREEIEEAASGRDGFWKKQNGEKEVGAFSGKEVMVFLGRMNFKTSREMIGLFGGLLSNSGTNWPVDPGWVPCIVDLVKKGHPEPEKLIGCGVKSILVRQHKLCSRFRTFSIVRNDGSMSDFCFRSCVNNILPLPKDLKDQGDGVIAVCACHVQGGMTDLEAIIVAKRIVRTRRKFQAILEKEEEERRRANWFVLGSMKFRSSPQMHFHFFSLLISSPLNQALRENDHLMLLELLKKGDPESEKNIGPSGVKSFEVRIHPAYDSGLPSFYLVRGDGSVEDFCFIKCIDNMFPLPEDYKEGCVGPCSCHHKEDGQGGATLGWRRFRTSVDMGSYFEGFINVNLIPFDTPIEDKVDKMTYTTVLDLLRKGDPEWEKKIGSGGGLQSIQIRMHPVWKYPFYFVVRKDGSMEPFCFWACVDNILPLPEDRKCRCSVCVKSRHEDAKGAKGGRRRGTLV